MFGCAVFCTFGFYCGDVCEEYVVRFGKVSGRIGDDRSMAFNGAGCSACRVARRPRRRVILGCDAVKMVLMFLVIYVMVIICRGWCPVKVLLRLCG